MTIDDPIQNLDDIDSIEHRRDGTVDLLIIIHAPFDASERHQQLLLDKIESYLRQINARTFRDEFGPPSPTRARIVVQCDAEPGPAMRQLLQNAVSWVEDNHASIALRVGPAGAGADD